MSIPGICGLILNTQVITDIFFTINGDIIADGGGFNNSGDIVTWRIDDGGVITEFNQNLTPAYTLVNPTANVKILSTDAFSLVIQWTFRDQNIVGILEMSPVHELAGQQQVDGNSDMTQINFGSNTSDITLLRAQDCNISGIFDISPLTNISGVVEVFSNPNLTGILVASGGIVGGIRAQNCNLTGVENYSSLSSIGDRIELRDNPNLTGVLFPSSTTPTTIMLLYDCDLTGELDLSMFDTLSGNLDCDDNNNLTSVLFPTTSGRFIRIDFNNCDITGVLDMSMLSNFSAIVTISNNSNLTDITFPTTSQDLGQFDIRSDDITGTFDLSGLTGLGGNGIGPIRMDDNPNMTDIAFPSTSKLFGSLRVDGCNLDYVDFTPIANLLAKDSMNVQIQDNSMAVADVNHILVDLAGMIMAEIPPGDFTGRSIDISGSNAAPDSTSGGFNGTVSVTQLQARGVTVTTS
ncbi:hypothetical protein KAR91_14680 [Candidatus Pacearchaeota archaeon]|nr:hypothetical protein [Candidatus Pacearchaeota archaeon]